MVPSTVDSNSKIVLSTPKEVQGGDKVITGFLKKSEPAGFHYASQHSDKNPRMHTAQEQNKGAPLQSAI